MIRTILFAGLSAITVMTGCSHRGVYEGTRAWRAEDCDARSSRAEREQCRAQSRMTWPEYEKRHAEATGTP